MFERFMTHLSDGVLHVCWLEVLPLVGLPCAERFDAVGMEGVGVLVWKEHW